MKPSKSILSGVQPSGDLHLGNYLGAIKNFVALQSGNDCIYCIVDLHAITVKNDSKELRQNTLEIIASFLATGLDYKKSSLFVLTPRPNKDYEEHLKILKTERLLNGI